MHLREVRKMYPDKPSCCQECQLFLECKRYKVGGRLLHSGSMEKTVLIVMHYPTEAEDNISSWDTTREKVLHNYVTEFLNLFQVYTTYAVRCYPNQEKVGLDRIRSCSGFLKEDIDKIKPDCILVMGKIAEEAVKELGLDYEYCLDIDKLVSGIDYLVENAFIRVNTILSDSLVEVPYTTAIENRDGILNMLTRNSILGIDLEWSKDRKITAIGLAGESQSTSFDANDGLPILKQLIKDNSRYGIGFVGHNLKEDCKLLHSKGINLFDHIQADTFIMKRELMNDTFEGGLKEYAKTWLMMKPYWNDITEDSFQQYSPELGRYCAADAYTSLLLYNTMKTDFVEEWRLMNYAASLDTKMIGVAVIAEIWGIGLDTEIVAQHKKEVEQELYKLEWSIKNYYGISPRSPEQILKVLQDKGYEIDSTKESVLQSISDELAEDILKFRELDTLHSRYMDNLLELQDSEGVIHHSIEIAKANTGRTACSNPNMQNQPKKMRNMYKSVFGDDGILVTVDHNQMEYRVFAYLSGNQELINAYKEGVDMHDWASRLTGISRSHAKTLNFGRLFLQKKAGLVKTLIKAGVPEDKAVAAVNIYWDATKRIESYQKKEIADAKKLGYVMSPYGRRGYRMSPAQIVNYKVQSMAGDINKNFALEVFRFLRDNKFQSHIWLEFHDAVELDIYKPEYPKIKKYLDYIITTRYIPDVLRKRSNIPLPLNIIEHSTHWG